MPKLKAAIYARQSIDKKDSISIETQIKHCLMELKGEDYETYIDRGFSGKSIQRPAFLRLLDDIKNNKINKIIIYRLDRISRSLLDFANLMTFFEEHNVSFISTMEKFDTQTPMGRAMLSITMVFAQLERETIAQRIKDNYYERAKKGFYMGGPPPFGFTKEEVKVDGKKTKRLKEKLDEIEIVKEMFDLYAYEGYSLGQISKYLNENNIKAPKGGNWDSAKISRILQNPVYVKSDADIYDYYKEKGCVITNDPKDFINGFGLYLYGPRGKNERKFKNIAGKTLSIALHYGIINSDTFIKCQKKLEKNLQLKNSGKGKHTYLSGLVKCGKCNYALTVVSANGYKYLVCRGHTNLHCCEGQTHRLKEVENEIEKIIKLRLKEEKYIALPAEEPRELKELKLNLIEIENNINNLINYLASSNGALIGYINKKINEFEEKKQKILERMNKIKEEQNLKDNYNDIGIIAEKFEKLTLEDKKLITNALIEKIEILDNNINVFFKF